MKRRNLDAAITLKLPALKTRELPFERKLRDALREDKILFIKLKPSLSGLPDRMAIGRNSIAFVELKAEDKPLDILQITMHDFLRRHGATVITIQGPGVPHAVRKIKEALR